MYYSLTDNNNDDDNYDNDDDDYDDDHGISYRIPNVTFKMWVLNNELMHNEFGFS